MLRLNRIDWATSLVLALGCLGTACGGGATYSEPVQPSVQGRASLLANPPSEPVAFTAPAPAPVDAPPPPAQRSPSSSTVANNKSGPLPDLPSQAPMYAPVEPEAPAVTVYSSTPSYYYNDYPAYYYYRPRSSVHIGVSFGAPRHYYRPWYHHHLWAY